MAKKAAVTGPNPLYDLEAFKQWQRERKATPEAFNQFYKRANIAERKLQHKDGAGWYTLPSRPEMRKLTDPLTGQLYDMPINDYENFLSFIRTDSEVSELFAKTGRLKDATTPADYISYVFEKSKSELIVQEGCGHISLLEYSTFYQLLRVTFTNNGNVVVYFRVPVSVANVLIALAQSKAQGTGRDGKPRHSLGMYFWDLVRIRGTIHGSRYAFEYTNGTAPTGQPGGRKQGGYYEVDTEPTVRHFRKIISDRREKLRVANKTAKDDVEIQNMLSDLKEVNKAMADGDMSKVANILHKYDIEQRIDTTRAVYTPTGQLVDEDKIADVKRNLKLATRGKAALIAGEESDYHSELTGAIDDYLSSSGKTVKEYEKYMTDTVSQMDARASLLSTSHRRAYNNLARPRMEDEDIDANIGVDIDGRSAAALMRQEQYLIKMGLWP